MDLPFELHIALRYLLAKRKQALHLRHLARVHDRRHCRRDGRDHRARRDDGAAADAARSHSRHRSRTCTCRASAASTTTSADVEKLRAIPHVTGVAPTILGKALVSASRGQDFITVKGIDPALEPGVTDISASHEVQEAWRRWPARRPAPGPTASCSARISANTLGVVVGDSVELTTGKGGSRRSACCRPGGGCESSASSASACTSSIPCTAWSRSTSRSGCSIVRRSTTSSSTSTTSTPRRPSRMKSAPGSAISTRRRTGGR